MGTTTGARTAESARTSFLALVTCLALAGCGGGAINSPADDANAGPTDAVAPDAGTADAPGGEAAAGSDAGGGVDGDGGGADGATGDDGGGPGVDPCTAGAAGPRLTGLTPSGPIEAQAGATYSGLAITNAGGPCITVDGKSNVLIVDSEIGPCGGEAAIVVNGSDAITIDHAYVHDSPRGVLATSSAGVVTRASRFDGINGTAPRGTAIEYDYMNGGTIDANCAEGSYGSDVISGFESTALQITGNEVHATITEWSAAGFTIGDSVAGNPGRDNYVARNKVYTTGGVPPGVFGSAGNTVLEHNCLTTGIQAYAYHGPFVEVTVRYNIIGPGSYVPDPSVIAGWDTNSFTDGTSCDGM
jgi:hypothetical protein